MAYERLLRLARSGDKGAASALLVEARRRGDTATVRLAKQLAGLSWQRRPLPCNFDTRAIAVDDDTGTIFLAGSGGFREPGLIRMPVDGDPEICGIRSKTIMLDVHVVDGRVYVLGYNKTIYRSEDDGENWKARRSGITRVVDLKAIRAFSNGMVYAGGRSVASVSKNHGRDFAEVDCEADIDKLVVTSGGELFAAGWRLYHSTDFGRSWKTVDDSDHSPNALWIVENQMLIAGSGSVSRTEIGSGQWEELLETEHYLTDICGHDSGRLVVTGFDCDGLLAVSEDFGDSWTHYEVTSLDLRACWCDENRIIVGGDNNMLLFGEPDAITADASPDALGVWTSRTIYEPAVDSPDLEPAVLQLPEPPQHLHAICALSFVGTDLLSSDLGGRVLHWTKGGSNTEGRSGDANSNWSLSGVIRDRSSFPIHDFAHDPLEPGESVWCVDLINRLWRLDLPSGVLQHCYELPAEAWKIFVRGERLFVWTHDAVHVIGLATGDALARQECEAKAVDVDPEGVRVMLYEDDTFRLLDGRELTETDSFDRKNAPCFALAGGEGRMVLVDSSGSAFRVARDSSGRGGSVCETGFDEIVQLVPDDSRKHAVFRGEELDQPLTVLNTETGATVMTIDAPFRDIERWIAEGKRTAISYLRPRVAPAADGKHVAWSGLPGGLNVTSDHAQGYAELSPARNFNCGSLGVRDVLLDEKWLAFSEHEGTLYGISKSSLSMVDVDSGRVRRLARIENLPCPAADIGEICINDQVLVLGGRHQWYAYSLTDGSGLWEGIIPTRVLLACGDYFWGLDCTPGYWLTSIIRIEARTGNFETIEFEERMTGPYLERNGELWFQVGKGEDVRIATVDPKSLQVRVTDLQYSAPEHLSRSKDNGLWFEPNLASRVNPRTKSPFSGWKYYGLSSNGKRELQGMYASTGSSTLADKYQLALSVAQHRVVGISLHHPEMIVWSSDGSLLGVYNTCPDLRKPAFVKRKRQWHYLSETCRMATVVGEHQVFRVGYG